MAAALTMSKRLLPYASLASVTFALLVDEILLNSIFHVLIGGGNTIAAISLALLGLSCAGIVAYLSPVFRDPARAGALSQGLLFWFSVSLMASTFAIMNVPLNHADLTFARRDAAVQLFRMAVYLTATVPFFLGGLAINVILRSHAERISRLYFSDLAGAALGCLASPLLLSLAGAPRGILYAPLPALLLASGSVLRDGGRRRGLLALPLLLLAVGSLEPALLRFQKLNSMGEVSDPRHRSFRIGPGDLEFERWALDAWTIIRSDGVPQQWENFRGWGLSERYRGPVPSIKLVNYNARFSTYVTSLDGQLHEIGEWLDSDLISVHFLLGRHYDKVLNIGAGGGREVLNALHHGAQQVTAVDISSVVVEDIMKGHLRSYSGELYLDPRVRAVADEGRIFVERSSGRFDLIDMSIVGGMNFEKMDLIRSDDLFTLEALRTYFSRLTEAGVFSYVMYTLRSDLVDVLARQNVVTDLPYIPALRTLTGLRLVLEESVPDADFREHVLIAGLPGVIDPNFDLVHIVASKSPFSNEERRIFVETCRELGFDVFHPRADPAAPTSALYAAVVAEPDLTRFAQSLPFSIRPARDDMPFNFAFDRSHLERAAKHGRLQAFLAANPVISLSIPIGLLALLLILTPLFWALIVDRNPVGHVGQRWDLLLYFACIGFGFMAVEIAVLFKLQLYLGKPIYGLSVGLFAFLLSSGLGSAFTERFGGPGLRRPVYTCVALLMAAGGGFFELSSPVFAGTIELPLVLRAAIAVAVIFPVAFLMGTFFPMGIKLISRSDANLIPWAWAINGCTSVLGILGSRTAALFVGFDRSLLIGLVAYLGVLVCVAVFSRSILARESVTSAGPT